MGHAAFILGTTRLDSEIFFFNMRIVHGIFEFPIDSNNNSDIELNCIKNICLFLKHLEYMYSKFCSLTCTLIHCTISPHDNADTDTALHMYIDMYACMHASSKNAPYRLYSNQVILQSLQCDITLKCDQLNLWSTERTCTLLESQNNRDLKGQGGIQPQSPHLQRCVHTCIMH